MFRLVLLLKFIGAFEENKMIQENLVKTGELFMVSIQFHGNFNPASETAFIKLDNSSKCNLPKVKGHICSGVIMNKLTILTSAHCVFQSNPELYTVQVNTYDLQHSLTKNVYKVEEYLMHHDFRPFRTLTNHRLRNDLALISLKSQLDFTTVTKIEMVNDTNIQSFKNCYTLGYSHEKLIKTRVQLLDIDTCKRLVHDFWVDKMDDLIIEHWNNGKFQMIYKGNICVWPQRCDVRNQNYT